MNKKDRPANNYSSLSLEPRVPDYFDLVQEGLLFFEIKPNRKVIYYNSNNSSLKMLGYVKKEKTKVASEARNKQLVMAQRMELMGVIAGGAVHDLKNLLSIIIGYSKLAVELEGEMEEEEKSEAMEIIKDTATTAIQLVPQILSFARQRYNQAAAVDLPARMAERIRRVCQLYVYHVRGLHQRP